MRLYVIVEDRFPVSDRALLHWPVVRSEPRDRVAARPAAPPAAATSSESNARSPGASAGIGSGTAPRPASATWAGLFDAFDVMVIVPLRSP